MVLWSRHLATLSDFALFIVAFVKHVQNCFHSLFVRTFLAPTGALSVMMCHQRPVTLLFSFANRVICCVVLSNNHLGLARWFFPLQPMAIVSQNLLWITTTSLHLNYATIIIYVRAWPCHGAARRPFHKSMKKFCLEILALEFLQIAVLLVILHWIRDFRPFIQAKYFVTLISSSSPLCKFCWCRQCCLIGLDRLSVAVKKLLVLASSSHSLLPAWPTLPLLATCGSNRRQPVQWSKGLLS